ncbi:MAG TPA: S9 family peptidase [Phycisphaerae bacterium]|nr:S9 family peptidase [Phycisphaerae bacterium]
MLAMERIADPQASPDGKLIVFVLTTIDPTTFDKHSNLWLVDADGQKLRRLTSHQKSDSNPRWAPDGRTIWFISTRSGSSQVWRISVDGGEAEQFTQEPLDAGNLVVSPDGRRIAYTMEVFPDCRTSADTRKRLDEIQARKSSGRVYDHLFIRHWDTWKDGRRSHLFVRMAEGGNAVDVMKGMDADVPSKPFGGPEEITFTPDGKSLVFSLRNAGRKEAWSTTFNLYLAPVSGATRPRRITTNPAWDTHPAFSPDGRTLAYLATTRPGYESDRFRIILKPWPNGKERVLTDKWDRSAGSIVWASDGRTIYTTAANVGQRSLFAANVASGRVRPIVKRGNVTSPVIAGSRIVFSLDHLRSPVELHSVRPDGSGLRALTRINAGKIAATRMGKTEQFSFAGWNDEKVWAYALTPADFDPSRRYPVAFLIHGGPQGSFGNNFHYRWNAQVYAAAGYAVVMVDFHGSTGYGQAFTDSIRDDWGGKPLVDLQKGLAAALERYPWMDGSRVAALGASYGGYMINWIAGNWPNRFRCLVNHDGNLDERMAYFDTEELWFPEWEHGGTPWANPAGHQRHNPIDHIKKWKTPMLVIHGANDFRVVDTQGISTFTALQRRGIPSKLLYFPDECHWVLKPANSVLWHETVLAWLDQWTKGRAPSLRPCARRRPPSRG